MSIAFTRQALRDLAKIRAYIAADNPNAASRMALRSSRRATGLSIFPSAADLAFDGARAN
jgi:plasmid stabilization system protein ParE